METTYQEIVSRLSEENPSYKYIIQRVFRYLEEDGYQLNDLNRLTLEEFESFFLRHKLKSVRTLRGWIFALNLYAKTYKKKHLANVMEKVDRMKISEIIQDDQESRKFISHAEYEQILKDVQEGEDYNQEYQVAFLMAHYDGLFTSDRSVMSNLRGSDLEGNVLTLRPKDGEPYTLEVEEAFARLIPIVAEQKEWYRVNYRGEFSNPIYGEYPDSVFKIELINNADYKTTYYGKYRKLQKRYMPFNVSPRNFYLSGILYRANQNLSDYGFSLEDAMKTRNPVARQLLQAELDRVHYPGNIATLREIVGQYSREIK